MEAGMVTARLLAEMISAATIRKYGIFVSPKVKGSGFVVRIFGWRPARLRGWGRGRRSQRSVARHIATAWIGADGSDNVVRW